MHRHPPTHVSVVIPVKNGRRHLHAQLTALASQDYPGSWDVVVSDNGSTDGLIDYMHGPTVPAGLDTSYVDSSDGVGVAGARNRGVATARGDFIAYLDSDDVARPGWLSAIAAAAVRGDLVSGSIVTTVINTPRVAQWRPVPSPDAGWPVAGWFPTAMGANFGAWRDVHDAIGGFDESMTLAAEDVDYVWRAQSAGFTMVHSADAVVDYRLRDNYRDFWDQAYRYGRGIVLLHKRFRRDGFSYYNKPLVFPLVVASLAVRNPLLPYAITRMTTGRWIFHVAHEVGKVHGSIVERTLCI
ncbi:glycosyltransferase family 2 protein [Williamsia limnetica]|uniref:glycosyltransferase family 2 protein n=1 Tax=Williamsia limnetica TaxID=882452 RepID=UPI0013144774|nr:glycosyltransferase [Williamsia limnetica]